MAGETCKCRAYKECCEICRPATETSESAVLNCYNTKVLEMSNTICFIITVLYGDELLRCGLKVDRGELTGDCAEYPMEPENRKQLWDLLPEHVRGESMKIVEVDEIFEIEEVV